MKRWRTSASEISDRADALSREQAKLISILRHQNRAEISGGAGSGKTCLALLKAVSFSEKWRCSLIAMWRSLAFLRHFSLKLTWDW
ncbi:PhoH family protein [Brevibacterium sp. RIT803]|nr:PhoH family protein [Brevibacterium sp. RIT 803]